ncbi:MAG: beta-N-acetylhexosaminidase [Cephaloticoccus sp.]|nr:beta-N-acetylhexosaminidase [Cephaloticoccus sp.]MCF7760292.1 beta-N-acetylhexosaminidase [Cephaloticoccus sp.]
MSPSHPSLVPQPSHCKRLDGTDFVLTAECIIVADPIFKITAQLLAARLCAATSWPLRIATPGEAGEAISRIEFQPAKADSTNPEAYTLKVTAAGVLITASSPAGAFYGCQTLLQLFPPAVFSQALRPDFVLTAPSVEIEDAPRFRWRGVMVDSSRFYQPIEALKKYIDLLSQHKLNVFHWHLVDDQGWRLEIKKYPRLTAIGSKRRETIRGHGTNAFGGDGVPVEGFYTQDEVRELVAYATERHVQILPEIEMPGHVQSAIAAYPEYGLLPEAKPVSCIWGIHETLYNVKPETFAFLKDVLTEVMALFPFEYLHIGGDEAIKPQWEKDPATQARIRELGLKDEHELQSWFIRQIEAFLTQHGRKLVGWDEILEGGLAKSATVMSWRGIEGAVESAKHGNDAIMCPNPFVYFDHYQSEITNEPLCIGGNSPLDKVHGYEPIPAELTSEQARHIIGVQGQLWTEYIPTPGRLEYMSFPRVCALAEVAWCPRERPDFAHFFQRLRTHLRRLDCQDVRYRAPLEYLSS